MAAEARSERDAYRANLVEKHYEASQSFDKAVLTLAGGALGLSITFIDKIAPDPAHLWLLAMAWAFLAASLLASFFSLLTSTYAIKALIEHIDSDQDDESLPGPSAKATAWLNGATAVLLALGVLALCGFVAWNALRRGA